MKKKQINILAINPGTKYMGLAIFHDSDLAYWGIKVLKGKWSKKKMKCVEKTIANLIDLHGVNILIVKKVNPSRSSGNLDELVTLVYSFARKRKVKIFHYTIEELKSFLALGKRINKMEIAGLAVARYQFLIHQLERERGHKHPYFIRMFEAIAAGILAFNKLDHK